MATDNTGFTTGAVTSTPKSSPVDNDRLLIEDSEDSYRGKFVLIGDLPTATANPEQYLSQTKAAGSASEGRIREMDEDINTVDDSCHNVTNFGGTEGRPNDVGNTTHSTHGWRETGYTTGTADGAMNLGGYDTLNNQLAGISIGQHNFLASDSGNGTHGACFGGSYLSVLSGDYTTCLGGSGNIAEADYATVVGGTRLRASGDKSTVVGGILNDASGDNSAIVGARYARATGTGAAVIGGQGTIGTATLSAAADEQDTTISVNTVPTGLAAGDVVYVALDDGLTHITTVGSGYVSGTTVNLTDAIPGSGATERAAIGNVVNFALGHAAEGGYSAVIAGSNNKTSAQGSVAMGQDAVAAIRSSLFIGADSIAAAGDAQAITMVQRDTTTGNDTSEDLVISSANDSRFNKWGSNVVVSGVAHVLAVVTADGSGGAPAAGNTSAWEVPFSIKALGGTGVDAVDFTAAANVGTVREIHNDAGIANAPTVATNAAAKVCVNVNSTPNTGTSGTIRWIARIDLIMTWY